MGQALPIEPFRERIVEELSRRGSLILTAPTGSGKSTQTPRFLLGKLPGRILVLEPRRLSARSLAARVAAEAGTPLGRKVGYQVRFDSRCGPDTAVVFQTYGVFIQQLLKAPELPGVGAVLLDEFHERTLECDLALAWLKALRTKRRSELRLAVMSATLEADALSAYLPEAAFVGVPGRLHPVEIRHLPPDLRAGPAESALSALQALSREGLDGSVLVFMPGLREIRRALLVLGPWCREQGLDLKALHGSMELSAQQQVLDPSGERRVIVATNVAETGLTIPGVRAVIDTGLHRVAGYDASRGINTLYLSRISLSNAAQRAGRAGRTAPGKCLRLWSKGDEAGMEERLAPEILRLELGALRLKAASLPETVEWLTEPQEAAWSAAGASLRALGATDDSGRITALGRALLRYPVSPKLSWVLEAARRLGAGPYERACAMAAVFESSGERRPSGAEFALRAAGLRWGYGEGRPDQAADLWSLAQELLGGSREELPREAVESFRQLKGLFAEEGPAEPAPVGGLARLWLEAFADRLAAREGEGQFYRLMDGRGALLPSVKEPPPLILALEIRGRAGGGQARQTSASLYLPVEVEAVERAFPGECAWSKASELDERRGRVVKEERLVFRGLVLARREAAAEKGDRRAAADLWAEKFAVGELEHPGLDERARQLVVRVALARRLYPEMKFPEMGTDDWRLIYGELCVGRNSLKEIERAPLLPHLEAYLGRALKDFLDRVLPASRRLPSGRTGRFTYFESRPPELSARLGDFIKMSGALALCEGRLPVLFDVLAPNYRTVQKTHDLGSFWANTYPTLKRELQRRYPKHPWP